MSKLRLRTAVSLDGFAAGPGQDLDNPLGLGGMRLHEWVFPLALWRKEHGGEGGEVNASTAVLEEAQAGIGATIMGRHMFGPYRGAWSRKEPWNGWWGPNPPYHHQVFVLTHHSRDPVEMEGGTTFHFVTTGIERTLELARLAAKGKDVLVAGGAQTARQYFNAGLVDEMWLHQVPILLGSGERLFEQTGDDLRGLTLDRVVAAPGVTHLKFVHA